MFNLIAQTHMSLSVCKEHFNECYDDIYSASFQVDSHDSCCGGRLEDNQCDVVSCEAPAYVDLWHYAVVDFSKVEDLG